MHKGRIRDGRLSAAFHVERVDAVQVFKGRIRDAHLVTPLHIERMDPT